MKEPMLILLGIVTMMSLPPTASAQSVATSFSELNRRQALEEGDTIWITYVRPGSGAEYREAKVKLVRLSDDAITVRGDAADAGADKSGESEIRIPESRVRGIRAQGGSDSLMNGTLIGAGVGAGFGFWYAQRLCANEGPVEFMIDGSSVEIANEAGQNCGNGGQVGGIFGAIGAGIGAAVDAARKKGRGTLIYSAPGPNEAPMSFSISPVLSPDRRGAFVSITW